MMVYDAGRMTKLMLDPAIGTLIVLCLALLFAGAGSHKLRDLPQFSAIFAAYELLPQLARPQLAVLVPLLECLLACGLLVRRTRTPAVVAAMLLLLGYAAAIGINLRRGRSDLACGCGGFDARRVIAPWMLWRNVLLVAVLGLVLLPWSARALEWLDAVTVGCGTVTCGLVYLCLDRLLGQSARSSALRIS
ncbi:MAG TPA: MauE/DoxX family redox-associated membrane protein [Steroidobacteraceae bacterium]